MEINMKKTVNVAAAILVKNNKILIAQRGYGEFIGMYEFPGGKIEKNETGEEAVKRELKEEMNADIKVENFYYHAHYEYPNFILEMDCYLCSLINENIDLLEHTDYKWIAPNEENINWIPADVQIIEEIRKRGI
jgi:8-oxo-dGTP diphosphatase